MAARYLKRAQKTAASGEADVRDVVERIRLTLSEISLIGTYTYTPTDLKAAVAALHSGAPGPPDWVEQRPLEEGPRAFDDLDKGRPAAAKVVLRPS